MYARVTKSSANPDEVEKGLAILREKVVPTVKMQKGFKGYLLLGDRVIGKSLAISLWETEADRDATGQGSAYFEQIMPFLAELEMSDMVIENYEVLINE
jgi:hypothetical protein